MSTPNTNLLIYLKQIGSMPGCRALHLHLSGLPKAAKTRDSITKAIGILNELSRRSTASRVFLLNTLDIVHISINLDTGLLRQTASNIHKIFGREPIASNVYGTEDFATLLEISGNDTRLLAYAETLFASNVAEHDVNGKIRGSVQVYQQVMERIGATDISTILLSQPAYATLAAGKMVPVFREMYVSIKALEDAFCPGSSLVERRTLFVELTEHLDKAVLKVVGRQPEFGLRSLSLNLNLTTLASKDFVAFDSAMTEAQRGKIVLEFHRNDVVANFEMFERIAPDLTAKGYSLCIDALDARLLAHFDLKGLHCRFAKLFWSQEAAASADTLRDLIAERAKRDEGIEYILARCDNAAAIRLAKHAGFSLLQGKLIDYMVKHNIPL
jgi:EAL domain-containing protein (putative c-di-GMP-specific phosphodiesterase class I)